MTSRGFFPLVLMLVLVIVLDPLTTASQCPFAATDYDYDYEQEQEQEQEHEQEQEEQERRACQLRVATDGKAEMFSAKPPAKSILHTVR